MNADYPTDATCGGCRHYAVVATGRRGLCRRHAPALYQKEPGRPAAVETGWPIVYDFQSCGDWTRATRPKDQELTPAEPIMPPNTAHKEHSTR